MTSHTRICPYCSLALTRATYRQHTDAVHNLACSVCGAMCIGGMHTGRWRRDILAHLKEVHHLTHSEISAIRVPCAVCHKFYALLSLADHQHRQHGIAERPKAIKDGSSLDTRISQLAAVITTEAAAKRPDAALLAAWRGGLLQLVHRRNA